jgi:DNA-binding transcriptional LysR family regulator
VSDQTLDLVSEGIDLAIRGGNVADDSLIAKRMGIITRHLVAAKSYVEKHGAPQTVEELSAHECMILSQLAPQWTLQGPNGPVTVPVSGRLHFNNADSMREAVLQGLGIGFLPKWWFTGGPLETGDIKVILPEWQAAPLTFYAVYSSRRFLAPKVRAMINFLSDEFVSDPLLGGAVMTKL